MSKYNTPEQLEAYREKCVDICKEDLNTEFCELPAAVAFWSERFAEDWAKSQLAEAEYDRAWAQTFVKTRNPEGKKPPAVEEAKALTDIDEDVVDLRQAKILAERRKIATKGVLDAVISKRDMLQSLGATQRAERSFHMRARSMEDDNSDSAWND